MANHCLFMGWNRPAHGREGQAVELFSAMIQYLTDQQKNREIESFEPVLLSTHGGDLNGFILVRGEAEKIDHLRHADRFNDLVTQCNFNVDGFGVIPGWLNDKLGEQMKRYGKLAANSR